MLGYDPESFWDQTPRTLSLAFEADNENRRLAHNEAAWTAWHTAGLQRAQRMPKLDKLLVLKPPTLEQQLEGLKNWVVAAGGKVVYKAMTDG